MTPKYLLCPNHAIPEDSSLRANAVLLEGIIADLPAQSGLLLGNLADAATTSNVSLAYHPLLLTLI